jgi:hypothetical protein
MTTQDIEVIRRDTWTVKLAEANHEQNILQPQIRLILQAARSLLPTGSSMIVQWSGAAVNTETPSLPPAAKDPFRELIDTARTILRPGVKVNIQWGIGLVPSPVAPPQPPIPPVYPQPIYCYPCNGIEMIA